MQLPGPPPLVGARPAPASSGPPQPAGASPSPPPPPLPSYASVLGASQAEPFCPLSSLPNIPPISLSPVSSSIIEGLPHIAFSPADFEAAAAHNNLTLLARFASTTPSVSAFDFHVNSTWGLSLPATVGYLAFRVLAIQFQDQADLSLAWSRSSRLYNCQSYLLLRWSHDHRRCDSPQAAVWMRFPGLPLPLHNPSILKAIGDSLGRFLCTDANTAKLKHPRAARLCVEMNISEPLPPAFVAVFGDFKFHQRIDFESRIRFCSRCHLQGHCARTCRKRKLAAASVSHPDAPSGKAQCGVLLPAGTFSPGPTNLPPPLPSASLPFCPPSVCGNDTMNSPLSFQPPFGPCPGPISPMLGPHQAHPPLLFAGGCRGLCPVSFGSPRSAPCPPPFPLGSLPPTLCRACCFAP
ncbi:DUF4283 domain-containing protein [Cephalotus follicularis]|uniref:DUF4283 domain-containing protein n=1 Tax=Cephalotus follicularis TaxID=3775 RepID=A0A1Q3B4H1_CEPFO|nr:DUF4283 domain-containing protein [Cephalotus follicularis]